jgi:hypothetical protein
MYEAILWLASAVSCPWCRGAEVRSTFSGEQRAASELHEQLLLLARRSPLAARRFGETQRTSAPEH